MQARVDAHFAGAITPEVETSMRAHLPGCDDCRHRYTRRLLFAKLDPTAMKPEERIARGLGLELERSNHVSLAFGASFLLVAAIVLFVLRSMPSHDERLASRGDVKPTPASHVQIFRSPRGGTLSVSQGSANRDDELAFAYTDGAHKGRLMIFGLDEHGHVYWYHPAWTNAADNPATIPVESDGARHELREAIAHHLDGKKLEVHALFVDRPLTVKQVERRLEGKTAPSGPLAVEGAIDHVEVLDITP